MRRAWRRRSRKAQVSAVATILGLLLVVTFLANYLATTLPNTMGQNDLQHELVVENQVAVLSARVEATALANAIGAQVSQPVTLGSQGAPPFADSDGGYLTALSSVRNTTGNYPQSGLNFTLAGPMVYAPPTGFGPGNFARLPSGYCTLPFPYQLTCSAVSSGKSIKYNFSAGDGIAYSVTLGTGGNLVLLNFSTNSSTISISNIKGMPVYIQILGSHDTLSLSNTGGGNNPISVNITGSWDTITSGSFPGGASVIDIRVVGDNDYINGDPSSGGNTMYVSFTGVNDTIALVPGSGSTYYTFFTGFDSLNPTSPWCPYGALSHNDYVTGYNVAKGTSANAKLYQSFNNSTAYPGNSTHTVSSRWQIVNQTVAAHACPFVTAVTVPFTPAGVAGFVVHLLNTYAPAAEVAYDQGAVVFAQPGGLPIFIVAPPITLSNGILTVFMPWFANSVPGEAGVGTADMSLRLLSTTTVTAPANGFAFVNGSKVTITITSPYAAAWYSYFLASSAFHSYVTCAGSNQVCTKTYNPAGIAPLGTVTLAIPTTGLTVNVVTAVYSVNIL